MRQSFFYNGASPTNDEYKRCKSQFLCSMGKLVVAFVFAFIGMGCLHHTAAYAQEKLDVTPTPQPTLSPNFTLIKDEKSTSLKFDWVNSAQVLVDGTPTPLIRVNFSDDGKKLETILRDSIFVGQALIDSTNALPLGITTKERTFVSGNEVLIWNIYDGKVISTTAITQPLPIVGVSLLASKNGLKLSGHIMSWANGDLPQWLSGVQLYRGVPTSRFYGILNEPLSERAIWLDRINPQTSIQTPSMHYALQKDITYQHLGEQQRASIYRKRRKAPSFSYGDG
jgi:hypothetical protein